MTGILHFEMPATSDQIQQPPLLHLASQETLSDVGKTKTGGDMPCSFLLLLISYGREKIRSYIIRKHAIIGGV